MTVINFIYVGFELFYYYFYSKIYYKLVTGDCIHLFLMFSPRTTDVLQRRRVSIYIARLEHRLLGNTDHRYS